MNKETLIKYGIIAVVALVLVNKLTKKSGGGGGLFGGLFGKNEPAKSELTELIESDQSGQIQGAATISKMEAEAIANRIKNAWGTINDDEEAIYSAFRQLRTLSDLLLVIEKYGYYQANALVTAEDLPTSLRARLSKKELATVNNILKERKIDYAF